MQKLKVLIADDNPRMASMIQNILMDDDGFRSWERQKME